VRWSARAKQLAAQRDSPGERRWQRCVGWAPASRRVATCTEGGEGERQPVGGNHNATLFLEEEDGGASSSDRLSGRREWGLIPNKTATGSAAPKSQ
jgi:hypothetical protein